MLCKQHKCMECVVRNILHVQQQGEKCSINLSVGSSHSMWRYKEGRGEKLKNIPSIMNTMGTKILSLIARCP